MVWLLTAALIAGITQRVCVGFFVAGMAAAWSLADGAGRRRAMGLAALAAVCVHYGSVSLQELERERNAFVAAFASGAVVDLSGRVDGFPRTGRFGTTFRFEGDGPAALSLQMRVSRFDVHAGDRLQVRASAVKSRRPPRSLFADGIVGVVRVRPGDLRVTAPAVAPPGWRLHRYGRMVLERRLGRDAALPLALLLGERGVIAARTRDSFAALGIAHLLALSGMHLGLVAVWAWVLLQAAGVPPRHREWVTALVLGGYVAVVGELHSLSRALAMAVAIVAARMVQRPVDAVAALARALFLLLALRPSSLYSVGFQLSFVATLAVVLAVRISPRFDRRGRVRRALAGVTTTALAGVAVLVVTAPLQAAYFGVIGALSPLSTVLFLPGVAVLLGASLLAVALDRVPLLGDVMCVALGACARVVETVAVWAAARGPSPPSIHPPHLVVYAAGLTLALAGRRRPALVAAGVAMMASAFAKTCGI